MSNQICVKNVGVLINPIGFHQRSLKKVFLSNFSIGRVLFDQNKSISVQALDDISFEVNQGDRLAVLGSNGAGKSTLLRVLAGVYAPTAGSIQVDGAVTSIIDHGIGLDPLLTGYENIESRLIMMTGGSYSADPSLFERVENVSNLGDFLHFPLYTYSTGMLMRLNFAISICSRPEILLLDEWLSVTDKDFSLPAQLAMKQFIDNSGIMVLASHNIDLLRSNCNYGLVLDKGKQVFFGHIEDAIYAYK